MRKVFVAAVLFIALPLSAASAQNQTGDIWFELPQQQCAIGLPYTVGVHVNLGSSVLNALTLNIDFDNAVLPVAFSAFGQNNPDIRLGRTLIDAGMTESDFFLYYHDNASPGIIRVIWSGAKAAKTVQLTGDAEILRITFHPAGPVGATTLTGSILQLMDPDFNDIGTPQVVPAEIQLSELQLPIAGTTFYIAGIILGAGMAFIHRQRR